MLTILAIWILWNLVHTPIQEMSYFFVGRLVGMHAKDCQLIRHFWKGDFVHGYILWEGGERWQILAMAELNTAIWAS